MRENGLLYIKQAPARSDGETGFDEDGNPIAGVPSYADPIPCYIRTVTDNRKGRYEDGVFRQASFEVLLEQPGEHFTASVVKLERYGDSLGEYTVQSIEPITTQGRIRITV